MQSGDFPQGDGISRLHWDLIIPPELRGRTALDEAVEVKPPSVDIAVEQQGICDKKMISSDPCPSNIGDVKHGDELLDGSIGLKIVLDHREENESLPFSHVDNSSQEECQLECNPIHVAEETYCSSPAGGTFAPETGSSLVNASTLVDEYPVCTRSPSHVSESVVVPEENIDAASVADLDVHTGGCRLIEVETQGENNVNMSTESEFGKMDQCTMFSDHLAEECSSLLLERNTSRQIEVSHIDALDNGGCGPDDNSKLEMSLGLSGSRPFTYQGSSDSVELSPGNASASGHVPITMDMKMENSRRSVIADENSNSAKSDASQYEKGEFGGTFTNSWGVDEMEDEEECVDYGTDSGEISVEADDNVECENMELSEVGYANSYAPNAGMDSRQDTRSQLYLQDRSVSGIQDTGCSKRSAGRVTKDCDRIKRHVEFPEGSDRWETNYSTSLGLKSSSRDQLSEGCRGFGDEMIVTDAGKYPPSRIERPKFFDRSNGKDRFYVKASRSGETSEPDFNCGALRRCRSLRPSDNTGREDYWVDSCNQQVPESHDSTVYYDTHNATHLGPKNAVEAVTAELESNGFVVAAYRTILRAGSSRHLGRVVSQSANASSQRTRPSTRRRPPVERGGEFWMQRGLENQELIPDRCTNMSWCRNDRDGPRVSRTGCMEHGPKHEPLYIREQSFSPQRRTLHLSRSHVRTPSRSRTRSRMWTPPRESRDHVMDRKPGKRRRSGSSYYKSEVMEERRRSQMQEVSMSSHQRPGYKCMDDAPSSRNHKSSSLASRWLDERNESQNRFREHKHRKYSDTRLDARGISQEHRFDPTESLERGRTDCYYCPMQSGKFPASTGVSRGPRHHTSGNHRSRHGNERDARFIL